jgi:hypothetical protein
MCFYRFAQFSIQGVLLGGDANDHQLQISRPVIYKGVRFVKTNWYCVALVYRCRFVVDPSLTVSVEYVIDFFDPLVAMQATPVITWNNPASITFGTTLSSTQLNAIASVPGNLVYTPAAGTTPATGTDTLSVTFTPTDTTNYTTATKTVQITVTQAAPVITWNNPAAITYGTALSATQLNATATVGGSFIYTPAAGSIPAAGTDISFGYLHSCGHNQQYDGYEDGADLCHSGRSRDHMAQPCSSRRLPPSSPGLLPPRSTMARRSLRRS